MNLIAGIYTRVSTEEQVEGYSLAAQERACQQYIERQGWTVATVYADEGISGRRADRPALQRMLHDIDQRRINVVVVHKLDRLARNLRLTLDIIERLRQRGAAFASVSEQLDFSTPIGWAMFQVQGVFAELYSGNLALETKKGLREKAAQGAWVGPVPLGYQRDVDGVLVPSADADAVRLMFALYVTGQHSDTTIADELNRLRYRTLDWRTGERRLFGRESVRTILRNRAYVGEVSAGGASFRGRHVPLVDEAQFIRVQQIRAERTAKGGQASLGKGGLLTQIVRCAVCGKRMWYHSSGRGSIYYYICSGRDHRTCSARMVPAPVVDDNALALLRQFTIPQDWHAEIVAAAKTLLDQEQQRPAVDKGALEAQLQRVGLAFADGALSETEYAKRRDAVRAQLAAATPTALPDVHAAAEMLSQMSTLIDAATDDERRSLVRALFTTFWLEKDAGIKAITPTQIYLPLIGAMYQAGVLMGWLTGV